MKKDFFSLLKELQVNSKSSWSEIKRSCGKDGRYKSIDSSSRREEWFREYQKSIAKEAEKNSDEVKENRSFECIQRGSVLYQ